MKFSIAPLPTNLGEETLLSFYKEVVSSEHISRVYVGEVFCPKRLMSLDLFKKIKRVFKGSGKKIIFSTLALPTNEDHLEECWDFVDEVDTVEVNNLGFLMWLKTTCPGKKVIMGPTCNLYNRDDLAIAAKDWGAVEAVIHFDILPANVRELISSSSLPLEVPIYGRFPLAFSWRCYTARFFDKKREDCGRACFEKKEIVLQNLEDEAAFIVNGPLVQPGKTIALIEEAKKYADRGLSFGRFYLSPGEVKNVVPAYASFLSGKINGEKLKARLTKIKGEEIMFEPVAGKVMVE